MNLADNDLNSFFYQIKKYYGFDFSDYSRPSVKRRLIRFMHLHNITSLPDLIEKLTATEIFFKLFLEEFTVNVTGMFRDPTFFKALREQVIPQLATYPYLKIWHAGCSTGEEVYSMAIVLKEEGLYNKTRIYATDINGRALAEAEAGIYNLSNMQEYTARYFDAGGKNAFSDYYTARYNKVLLDQSLKTNILFSSHNLVNDASFNEFNMIICRNVLIYFNRSLQQKVTNLFYDSLITFGFLGLGTKESVVFTDLKKNFEEINYKLRIYRKIP